MKSIHLLIRQGLGSLLAGYSSRAAGLRMIGYWEVESATQVNHPALRWD